MLPDCGSRSLMISCARVLFPHPLLPTIAVMLPFGSLIHIFSSNGGLPMWLKESPSSTRSEESISAGVSGGADSASGERFIISKSLSAETIAWVMRVLLSIRLLIGAVKRVLRV